MRCETYGYLSSRTTSPPHDQYPTVLPGGTGTGVRTTYYMKTQRPGVEPFESKVPRPNHSPPIHTLDRANGEQLPGRSTSGDAKQPHRKYFMTNDHESEFDKVC